MIEEDQEITSEAETADVEVMDEAQMEAEAARSTKGNKKVNNKKESAALKEEKEKTHSAGNVDLIMNIPVEVQVVLGSTTMPVANVMNLGRGAVVTLDKQIGDPVDIVVNGRIVARGEVIVMEDDSSRFGVSLTEVMGK